MISIILLWGEKFWLHTCTRTHSNCPSNRIISNWIDFNLNASSIHLSQSQKKLRNLTSCHRSQYLARLYKLLYISNFFGFAIIHAHNITWNENKSRLTLILMPEQLIYRFELNDVKKKKRNKIHKSMCDSSKV